MLFFNPASRGFSLAWFLTFTKSFASNVCRVVGCFYMMSSDFTFLCRGLYHITPKSNRNGNEKETGADVCPAIASGIVHGEALVSYTPPPPIFFFSWVLQPPKGKLKTKLMHNFWGANKVHYGRCASGVLAICFFLCPVTVPEVFAIVNSAQFNFLLVSNVAL